MTDSPALFSQSVTGLKKLPKPKSVLYRNKRPSPVNEGFGFRTDMLNAYCPAMKLDVVYYTLSNINVVLC
jgi:hypothetical protein